MFLSRITAVRWLVSLSVGGLLVGCGGRSILEEGEVIPECEFDEECDRSNLCHAESCIEGECVLGEPVVCAEAPECFASECNPETGACDVTPLTEDVDGDGHNGPLVGFAPGSPGACGDDCDDTNALASPGGVEVCDGADNDCDGIIDNGSAYLDFFDDEIPEAIRVASSDQESAGRRGLAYGDGIFAVGYWGKETQNVSYFKGFDVFGNEVIAETAISNVNAPSFGPDVVWSGESFATAWSDPRVDNNYEVYFARFDTEGNKLGPDLRVTEAEDFSIHPRMIVDQGRYVMVWDDRRDELTTGGTKVFAQLIDLDGTLIGENIQLSDDTESAEYPYVAATDERIGVVYTSLSLGEDEKVTLRFRTFDKQTLEQRELALLSDTDVRAPRVVAVGDNFVVTWDVYGVGPGEAIRGAVVNEDGILVAGPSDITSGATFARSHGTVSLGDRFLMLWADDFYGNYELSAQVLGLDFEVFEPRRRLTDEMNDTLGANLALGDGGNVGVLFDDWRSGTHQTYLLSVGCGESVVLR